MFLAKRYFDVVSESGAWAIAYDITMPLGLLTLRYCEVTGTGIGRPRWKLRPWAGGVSGTFRVGDVGATWKDVEAPPEACFDNDMLTWRLSQLRSRAVISTRAQRFAGLGYGETLTLKRAPWLLGIGKLQWGRFLSAQTFLTWIIADGEKPIHFGVHGTTPTGAVTVAENTIGVGEAQIQLGEEHCRIATGDVFAGRPRMARLVCRALSGFSIRQHKAVYNAHVTTATRMETGYALAEQVTFG